MFRRSMLLALLVSASLASSAQTLHPTPDSGAATFGGGNYVYDPAGNIIGIDNQTFLYDTTGRLASATVMAPDRSMVTQTYTYDVYGNLLTMTRPGVTQTMDVDVTTNRLTNNGAMYDAAGNLTQWTAPGTATSYKYAWDPLGNLQAIRLGNAADTDLPAVAYIYTADDERLWTFEPVSDDSHFTIRDLGGQVLTDFHLNQGTWSWTRDYFYRDGVMLASAWPTLVQHYSVDHLGTPRLITDGQGNQLATQTFLPFGEELQQTFANGASIKKFTGHERDADPGLTGTSLDYMHARYDNGLMGRFLSVDPGQDWDPRQPQSWNLFAYVRNDPIRHADPTGRATDDDKDKPKPTPQPPKPEPKPHPVGADGKPLPPPVPLPPGKNGEPNAWEPVVNLNPRPGQRPVKWKPRYPVPSPTGAQPSGSWDPEGHYDVDIPTATGGPGDRDRVLPDGTRLGPHHQPLPFSIVRLGTRIPGYAAAGAAIYAGYVTSMWNHALNNLATPCGCE